MHRGAGAFDGRPRHPRANLRSRNRGLGVDPEGARSAHRASPTISISTKAGCAWRRPTSAAVSGRSFASIPRTSRWSPPRRCCAARSNGSRTAASISPMRRRSAISIGRSRLRRTPRAACAACAAALIHDIGAYALQDVNIPYNSATTMTGPYMVPALAMDVIATHTNKAPVSSVRGAGYPQAAFAMERMMDRLARALKIDRAELRRRNLIPAEKMPYLKPLKARSGEQVQYDSGDYPGCQAEILQDRWLGRFSAPPGRSARARPLYRHRTRPRHQGHRPRPVRIRQCARVADRPHHGFDRRGADGAGPCHRAGANLRRGVRRARAGCHRGRRRHRGGAARASAALPAGRRSPPVRRCRSPRRRWRPRRASSPATCWKRPKRISKSSTAKCAWSARRSLR